MSSWRDQILKEFTPKVANLTLVADPDGLILEEGVLEGIRKRGFELIPFEDPIAFRYAYESKFRSRWDRGEHTELVVVLRSQANDLGSLPYDLLQAGRRLSFTLGEIFPDLSYPVVTSLDRGHLDLLFKAQKRHAPGTLGDNATKEFILRHVFEIAPELVKQPSDLLRVLLRKHYRGQRVPHILDERFIQILRQNSAFDKWPLEMIVPDRDMFFSFLQERWQIFLDDEAAKNKPAVKEDKRQYGLTIAGPMELPFDHHDIRVYIDNLFLEGLLEPVTHEQASMLSKKWFGIGIKINTPEADIDRLRKLIDSLKDSIPAEDGRHGEWLHFARGWAKLTVLGNQQTEEIPGQIKEKFWDIRAEVDRTFSSWISNRFSGLINLPPVPPVMLHHMPRFLCRQLEEDASSKVAMIVVDGLSLDQWLIIRDTIASIDPGLRFRDHAIFAWIPSLTSVSRQAAFAGKPPIFFPNSIKSTDREPSLWEQFWVDQGLTPSEIVYYKGLGHGSLDSLSEALSHPKAKVAGLVVNKVDKIMHGIELGSAGMHNQVKQWCRQPYIKNLFDLLLDRGYKIWLTSDHGNIEAEGCGKPKEGSVADLRGERVRIYSDSVLRGNVKERFPSAIEWPTVGLPENFQALIAPPRKAFVSEKKITVCHGGISLEELIVPLVRIERKEK